MTDSLPPLTWDDSRIIRMGDAVAFLTYPTAGAVLTDEGAVLIDGPMSPVIAEQWRQFITQHCPIKYHIICEHHEDHTVCSTFLGADTVVTSEVTLGELDESTARDGDELREMFRGWGRDRLFDDSLIENFEFRRPDLTYDKRLNFTLGGKRFVVFKAPGHTLGSSIVHAVDDRVAFVADNIFPWRCAPPAHSADPWQWLQTLGILEALDVDWYVPGHADPIGREGIHDQRIGLLHMVDTVRQWKRDGWSRERVVAEGVCEPLEPRPAQVGIVDVPPGLAKIAPFIGRLGLGRVFDALDDHPSGGYRTRYETYHDYNAAFRSC